ncbi:MAG: S8 family serine peptidase, partial [Planctomycetota bacterium]
AMDEDSLDLSLGNMIESWWVRALEWAAAEKDFLIVASNGNGTSAQTPMPLYPAAGSNVLSVGVIDTLIDADGQIDLGNFSTPKADNSSTGPTEDKRCKPDLVAPGTALVPSGNGNDGYMLQRNWSSLATPIVAGTAALLEQKASSDATLKAAFKQPGKALVLKSILMNSARKLPYWHKGRIGNDDDHETPLDFTQGAGVLDALAAYEQLTAGKNKPGRTGTIGWDNRLLRADDEGYEYAFDITEPNQIITATLCWNRVYQKAYPFKHMLKKDADFRLELWGIDPNEPQNKALLDYSDSVNDNVEHIYFACDPNYTAYAIRVRFNDDQPIDSSARHRFAVAWSAGPDRQVGNQWWGDLNADNRVNTDDKMIYSLIEFNLVNKTEMAPLMQPLGLSENRLQLLTKGWPAWKPYLSKWQISE